MDQQQQQEEEKIPIIKCRRNHKHHLEIMNLTEDENQVRVCMKCVSEDLIQPQNWVLFQDVIDSNKNTVFDNYPPLQDLQINKKLKELEGQAQEEKKKIQDIFNGFIKMIEQALGNMITYCKKQIEEIDTRTNAALSHYQSLIQLTELKKLVLGGDNLNNQLSAVIRQLIQNREQNSNDLTILLENYTRYINSFDVKEPMQKQKDIIDSFKSISFFSEYQGTYPNQNVEPTTEQPTHPLTSSNIEEPLITQQIENSQSSSDIPQQSQQIVVPSVVQTIEPQPETASQAEEKIEVINPPEPQQEVQQNVNQSTVVPPEVQQVENTPAVTVQEVQQNVIESTEVAPVEQQVARAPAEPVQAEQQSLQDSAEVAVEVK